MRATEYTGAAFADLDGIWDYTAARWGIDQAERYLLGLRAACEEVASGLREGRPYAERPGYFRVNVGRHAVFYIEVPGGIRVMRVLHQRMDVGDRF